MIQSMTGYGKAVVEYGEKKINVEESQRKRRLRFREDAHIVSIHPIISQKLNHILSYAVVARLADKRSIYTRTPQRDDCIE